jgi:hypothetical protein
MASYKVFIVDPLEHIARSNQMPVAEILSGWFDPIVKKAGFDWSHVHFPQHIATPAAYELMVYVCGYDQSVVQHAPGGAGLVPDPVISQHKGVTLVGPPAASEVYLKNANPMLIAALIFHELMHNKLHVGNSMHEVFRNAGVGNASLIVDDDFMGPNAAESDAMSKALNNPVPQWTGGQEMLWRAARQRSKGDSEFDSDIKYKRK